MKDEIFETAEFSMKALLTMPGRGVCKEALEQYQQNLLELPLEKGKALNQMLRNALSETLCDAMERLFELWPPATLDYKTVLSDIRRLRYATYPERAPPVERSEDIAEIGEIETLYHYVRNRESILKKAKANPVKEECLKERLEYLLVQWYPDLVSWKFELWEIIHHTDSSLRALLPYFLFLDGSKRLFTTLPGDKTIPSIDTVEEAIKRAAKLAPELTLSESKAIIPHLRWLVDSHILRVEDEQNRLRHLEDFFKPAGTLSYIYNI